MNTPNKQGFGRDLCGNWSCSLTYACSVLLAFAIIGTKEKRRELVPVRVLSNITDLCAVLSSFPESAGIVYKENLCFSLGTEIVQSLPGSFTSMDS